MSTTWHVDDDALIRFAREPEVLDDATASSLELHVTACARCRAVVADHADMIMLEGSWDAIADRIDAPRPRAVERLLVLLGVGDAEARLVAATPALRWSWFVSMTMLLAAVVAVTRELADPGAFLVAAPLVPLAAVALAFWPGGEPAGETGKATPAAGLKLAVQRTVAVLVPSGAVVVAGALAAPGLDPLAAAWLLPALGLCAATLALGTWLSVDVAAGTLAAGWLLALAGARARGSVPARELVPFTASSRAAWIAVVLLAFAVVAVRRDQLADSRRSP
jgi:hypothetical protein